MAVSSRGSVYSIYESGIQERDLKWGYTVDPWTTQGLGTHDSPHSGKSKYNL